MVDGAAREELGRVQGSVTAVVRVAGPAPWTTLQRTVALRLPLPGTDTAAVLSDFTRFSTHVGRRVDPAPVR